jgi:hypothetical protein
MKIKNSDKLVAIALRNFADVMLNNPNAYSVEDGKALDRALRSCRGIIDIDVVWVRWRYVAESKGWITDSEMYHDGRTYRYPEIIE